MIVVANIYFCESKGGAHSYIDYSETTGKVRVFVLHGVRLYDEIDEIAVAGWENQLAAFIREKRLGLDADKYSFVKKIKVLALNADKQSKKEITAMYEVKCAWCGKILRTDSEVENSHGICEQCKDRLLSEWKPTKPGG